MPSMYNKIQIVPTILIIVAILVSSGSLVYVTGLSGKIEMLTSTTEDLTSTEKEVVSAVGELGKAVGEVGKALGEYGEKIAGIEERIGALEEAAKERPPEMRLHLRIGQSNDADTYDPQETIAVASGWVTRNVFDRLLSRDYNGEIQPHLAESWEWSEDGKSVTLHLRKDVKFHNGEPFNAEVAKENFDRMNDPEFPQRKATMALIESYEVIDEYTFVIRLYERDRFFLYNLAGGIGPMVHVPSTKEEGWDDTFMVGTGPFMFGKRYHPESVWVRDNYITIVRNPDYNWAPEWTGHKGPALLEKITIFMIPESAGRVAALEAGKIDLIGSPMVPAADVPRLMNNPEVVVGQSPMGMCRYLSFHSNQPPFNDIRLRQAVACVIDREAICKISMSNLDRPCYGVVSPVFGKWFVDCKDLFQPNGPDIDRANQLLDEAGWKMAADGWRYNAEGKRLEWVTTAATAYEWHEAILTVLQPQLEEVGMKMNIQVVDRPTWSHSKRITTRWPETGFSISRLKVGTPNSIFDGYMVKDSSMSTDVVGWGPGPATTPITDFYTTNGDYDAEMDALVHKMHECSSEEEAVEAMHEATRLLAERNYFCVISNALNIEAYSSKLVGWETRAYGSHMLDVYIVP